MCPFLIVTFSLQQVIEYYFKQKLRSRQEYMKFWKRLQKKELTHCSYQSFPTANEFLLWTKSPNKSPSRLFRLFAYCDHNKWNAPVHRLVSMLAGDRWLYYGRL